MSTSTTASTTKTAIKIVRPDADGAITIPAAVLDELGVSDRDALLVTHDRGAWRVTKVAADNPHPHPHPPADDANEWYRKLYALYAPVRAQAEADGLTEQEINDAIDEALAAVRSGRD